jgi:hypothetical protein
VGEQGGVADAGGGERRPDAGGSFGIGMSDEDLRALMRMNLRELEEANRDQWQEARRLHLEQGAHRRAPLAQHAPHVQSAPFAVAAGGGQGGAPLGGMVGRRLVRQRLALWGVSLSLVRAWLVCQGTCASMSFS